LNGIRFVLLPQSSRTSSFPPLRVAKQWQKVSISSTALVHYEFAKKKQLLTLPFDYPVVMQENLAEIALKAMNRSWLQFACDDIIRYSSRSTTYMLPYSKHVLGLHSLTDWH